MSEAERSFLSFARAETHNPDRAGTPHSPADRAGLVYLELRREPSKVWHLLSWVVVALEAHLAATATEQPSELSEGEIRAVGECVWGRTWAAWESMGFSDEFARDKWNKVVAVIRTLDEYRAEGKRGK